MIPRWNHSNRLGLLYRFTRYHLARSSLSASSIKQVSLWFTSFPSLDVIWSRLLLLILMFWVLMPQRILESWVKLIIVLIPSTKLRTFKTIAWIIGSILDIPKEQTNILLFHAINAVLGFTENITIGITDSTWGNSVLRFILNTENVWFEVRGVYF